MNNPVNLVDPSGQKYGKAIYNLLSKIPYVGPRLAQSFDQAAKALNRYYNGTVDPALRESFGALKNAAKDALKRTLDFCREPFNRGATNLPSDAISIDKLQGPPNKRGNAPIGDDGFPVELHHRNQNPDGPLDEMTRRDHREGDNFKKNHQNTGQEKSKIDKKTAAKERREHWKKEWDSGKYDDL